MSGNIKKIVEPNSGIDYSLEKEYLDDEASEVLEDEYID